jgi:3-methyladenine DNA glycosylase AlkD
MPFHGVPRPSVRATVRSLARDGGDALATRETWEHVVRRLFDEAEWREEQYAALAICAVRGTSSYQRAETLQLYRHLVVTGAWWDLVDEASHRVGDILLADRVHTTGAVRAWSLAGDLWHRRCAIICQLGHRHDTDRALLADAIDASIEDKRFFLRKAIGWALRDYARSDPDWVLEFVVSRADRLAPLSQREALRHLTLHS